jgi:hypothetical protein
MKSFFLMSLIFVFPLSISAVAASPPDVTSVEPNTCSQIPPELDSAAAKIIGSDWALYKPYMCIYPVRTPEGALVLDILALDIPKADAANALVFKDGKPIAPDDVSGNFDPIPKPVVITLSGELLATLAEPFPRNDPATSSIEFSNWNNGFPYRIIQYVNDPTQATAPQPFCPPPYIWTKTAQRYVEAKGNYYALCPKMLGG